MTPDPIYGSQCIFGFSFLVYILIFLCAFGGSLLGNCVIHVRLALFFWSCTCKVVVLGYFGLSSGAMIYSSHAHSMKTVAEFYNYYELNLIFIVIISADLFHIDNSIYYTYIVQDRKYVTAKSRVLHPEFRGRMVCSYLPDFMFPVWRYPI